MSQPKAGLSKSKQPMHYSVGALIKIDNKYLLMDRINPPPGFAGPAGHIDEGEEPVEALIREVFEETALKVTNKTLLFEEELDWNYCTKGITTHYWYLYSCEVEGTYKRDLEEARSMDLYTVEQIKTLKLERVWDYWFRKLGILD